ncbi:MAG: hypothetical protein K0R62_3441 [Nonomuraea muscovyensis]|nr:hypothetical protein [Nonomuraea muscovyensis]
MAEADGIQPSVLLGQRTLEEAVALIDHQLNRIFTRGTGGPTRIRSRRSRPPARWSRRSSDPLPRLAPRGVTAGRASQHVIYNVKAIGGRVTIVDALRIHRWRPSSRRRPGCPPGSVSPRSVRLRPQPCSRGGDLRLTRPRHAILLPVLPSAARPAGPASGAGAVPRLRHRWPHRVRWNWAQVGHPAGRQGARHGGPPGSRRSVPLDRGRPVRRVGPPVPAVMEGRKTQTGERAQSGSFRKRRVLMPCGEQVVRGEGQFPQT